MKTLARLSLSFFLATASAFAQLDTATVTGTVADSSGAIVPAAKVSVVNIATNFQSLGETNAQGLYRVQSLRPGMYRVSITSPGFRTSLRENVELRAGDVVAINVSLEIGNTTDTVEITGNTPLLETETSSTGTVLAGDYFSKLPLYQRDPKNALYLTPGVQYSGNGYAGRLENFHIAGLRDNAIGLFEDGMIGTSAEGDVGGNARGIDTIMNSIQEIKVLTTGLPAEYGHSAGGAIAIVKKSGTNQIHGSVSEFGRVRRMQHRKYFDKYQLSQIQPGTTSPSILLINEPDANISGPVVIPKIYDGHNKTFFMFGYQKYIEKQGKQTFYNVPTPEMLNGDFSFGGIGQQIYDPRSTRQTGTGTYTRDIFPNRQIPVSSFDPVARKVLALNPFVAPNLPGTVTSTGVTGNLLLTPVKVVIWDYYTLRFDQQITTNLKAYGTWTLNNKWERTPNPNVNNALVDGSFAYPVTRQDLASVGLTWVVSPTVVNDTRVGYNRQAVQNLSPTYRSNIAGLFGIPNALPDVFPTNGGGTFIPTLPGYASPSVANNENFTFKNDLTNVRGRHTLKAGYELMYLRNNEYGVGNPTGDFNFASTSGLQGSGTTTISNTGNSFAAFLLGSISSASANVPLISWLPRSTMHSAYIQDDWKVLPTLTLNLGVRYQVEGPFDSKYHQISNFDPTKPDNVVPGALGLITHPTNGLNRRDWNNFQPRFGMAWNPSKKFVVRGAFALSTQDLRLSIDQRSEYSNTANITAVTGDPRPLFQISNFPGFNSYYPAARADGTVPFQGNNYSGRNVTWIDPNLRNPYTMSWNLGVQHELTHNYLLDVSYQGSAAVGLVQNEEYNGRSYDWAQNLRTTNPTEFTKFIGSSQNYRPFTNYGNITLTSNLGHSTFHSGTVKVEKRYSRGLTFLGFYTYSKSIDNNVGGNYYLDGSLLKGRSSFDQTHRFSTNFSYELPVGKGRRFMSGGGVKDKVLGGWDLLWVYQVNSGTPLTFGYGDSPYTYLPGFVGTIGGRANMTQRPQLRDNWQDLGGDRFTTANQNSLWTPESLSYLSYPDAYTFGNGGRNVTNSQRIIAASGSLSKEVQIKERLRFLIRMDYQNPFKWYNWGSTPNTTFTTNATNAKNNFGKVGQGGEATTNNGGTVMMNLTMSLVW